MELVRVDDRRIRRIISGILFVLREGCRWRALPDAYGPAVADPTPVRNCVIDHVLRRRPIRSSIRARRWT